MNKEQIVLGIETSCDDTSICLLKNGKKILAHQSFGQEESLAQWGGVVPEIAARNHLQKVVPLLKSCFEKANITAQQVDLIGVTTHPGLLGPLLTGLNAAKTLSLLYKKPIVAVNHLYAHLEAIHLTEEVSYPYLGLLVSGGHSIYFWVESSQKFTVLGSTIDDAAGEAFDKGGKLLELGYPAGKIIDELSHWGNEDKFEFPIGLRSSADARLSYSGLKTALKVKLEQDPNILKAKPLEISQKIAESQLFYDICASYQKAIVKALELKLRYAITIVNEKFGIKHFPVVVGGGVACNSRLRKELKALKRNVHIVAPQFCTDNGAMIAHYASKNSTFATPYPDCLSLDARGRFIDKKDFN